MNLLFWNINRKNTTDKRQIEDYIIRCIKENYVDIAVFADEKSRCQSGVCSFVCDGMDCETVGNLLGERGIAVRAGLHCAPYAHESAGTLETGTVRVSIGYDTFEDEIAAFLRAVSKLPPYSL